MEINSVKSKIKTFIVGRFPLAKNTDDDHRLLANGVLDSLGVLEVVTFIEGEFGFTVTDEELLPENFASISTLSVFVQRKLNSTQPVQ